MQASDIFDTIMRRVSVRSYAPQPPDADSLARLSEACAEAEAPFGGRIHLCLVRFGDADRPVRPGTYGVIRGASHYLVLATDGTDSAALSGGYAMERVVLEATAMDLGTCWIAVTFRPGSFRVDLPEGMRIVAVSPVGRPAAGRHLLERITRLCIRESSRKPFASLFFRGSFATPLPEDDGSDPLVRALQAVRRAPSAMNAQPWRVLVDADMRRAHFFMVRGGDCVLLDMGIALCHYALTAPPGRFERLPSPPISAASPAYLISYVMMPR